MFENYYIVLAVLVSLTLYNFNKKYQLVGCGQIIFYVSDGITALLK